MGGELYDDLTNQILIRLPVKSIFRFKCVSKTWNCFLSSPSFRRKYRTFRNNNKNLASSSSSSSPLLGFFQFQNSTRADDDNDNNDRPEEELELEAVEEEKKVAFLPTCSEQGLPITSHDFIEKLGFFFNCSSGGLIVCGHHPTTYYVCNPVTNHWVSLPLLVDKRSCPSSPSSAVFWNEVHYSVGIYCEEKDEDEDFGVSYKVVRACKLQYHSDKVRIVIYSSKTGVWRRYIVKASHYFELVPQEVCISIKGVFFWVARTLYIAAYNPKKSRRRMLLIWYPRPLFLKAPTLGESADGLIQCVVDDDVTPGFKVFVLKRELGSYGYSKRLEDEWVLRYTVGVDIPGMVWDNRNHPRNSIYHFIHENQPRRLALDPQNPLILYLRVGPSFFSCDLATGAINLVSHGGSVLPWDAGYKLFPYFQLEWPLSPLPKNDKIGLSMLEIS